MDRFPKLDSFHVAKIDCRNLLVLAGLLAATSSSGQVAHAQTDSERLLQAPPVAQIMRPNAPAAVAVRPEALERLPGPLAVPSPVPPAGEAFLDLDIVYTDATIYNPATNKDDAVHLRSYRDARSNSAVKIPFVAPTIEVVPGDTVRLTLHNKLPSEDPSCVRLPSDPDLPHCFNHTNLHSHGLWVSPSGNSDNVLLDIAPGVAFQYEYNVPLDHPAGTFWYHPHEHGSTALQVSSGMAGVLLVRSDRKPTREAGDIKAGDIDTLVRQGSGAPFPERLLLMQQIQYACRDENGKIKTSPNGVYVCDSGDVGGIEGYDQFGPRTWPRSGRYTTINGDVLPTFPDAQVGRIERWRLVHAGVRETIKLEIRKAAQAFGARDAALARDEDAWIKENCPGAPLSQFDFASDGLTRGAISERTVTVFQPGYREDLLILFPEPRSYCVIDDQAPANASVNSDAKSRKLLGKVTVAPGVPVGPDLRAAVLSPASGERGSFHAAGHSRTRPLRSRRRSEDHGFHPTPGRDGP
jgi:L-ascorbate oxidase